MILTPNLRLIAVDDQPSLRHSVLRLVARSANGGSVLPTGAGPSRVSSSENSAVTIDLLADAVVARLIKTATTVSTLSSADAFIEELTSNKRAEAAATTLLLVHLNLKTKDSGRRWSQQGLSLYEAVLSRLRNTSSRNAKSMPPVLFYTIDSCGNTIVRANPTAEFSWNRLEELASSAALKLDDIVWQVPAPDADHVLDTAFAFWSEVSRNKKAWSTYRAGVLQTTIERMNGSTRHSFSAGRRAPVRVLLGALQSGHVQWDGVHAVLQAYCESEPVTHKSGALAAVAAYRHDVTENYKRTQGSSAVESGASALPLGRTYLLVDDHVAAAEYCCENGLVLLKDDSGRRKLTVEPSDNGWGAALACLTSGTVVCTNSPEDLHRRIKREAVRKKRTRVKPDYRKWDAVLLDYEFQSKHNGGHYLRQIKNRQFDLPVVMFTGLDDSHAAKWCLSHGASAYFVKEGLESEGRNSLSAYLNLRCILDSLPSCKERRRQLWQSFTEIERLIEAVEENVYANHIAANPSAVVAPALTIAWNLKQAFYWLFLSQRTSVGEKSGRGAPAPRAAGPSEVECAAGISTHSHSAMEHLIGSLWLLGNGRAETIESWFEHFKKAPVKGISGMLAFAKLDARDLRLQKLQQTVGDSHCSEPRLDLAKGCLEDVLHNFRTLLTIRRVDINAVRQTRLAESNGPTPDWRRLLEKPIGHAETAELGARDLVNGWAQIVYPSKVDEVMNAWRRSPLDAEQFVEVLSADPAAPRSPYGQKWHDNMRNAFRLLLIDDDFDRTGWDSALRIVCGPKSLVDSCKLPDLDRKTPAELNGLIDVILLDLRMPEPGGRRTSPEVGINTLARLREMSRAVPVVMITASDDAFWTSQALQNGAVNYFLKRYSGIDQQMAVASFLRLISEMSRLMGRGKPARLVWREIVELKELKAGPPPDRRTLETFWLKPNRGQSISSDWINCLVTNRLDSVFDHFVRALSVGFRANSRIDVDAWLLEGLHQPLYRLAGPASTPHALLLALKCGQLVECLTLLTMAYRFPSARSSKRTGDLIDHLFVNLSPGKRPPDFLGVEAVKIWKERNDAAHGYFKKGMNALAAKNPELAVRRTIKCTREWLQFLGWR